MELYWRLFVHPTGVFPTSNFDDLDGCYIVTQKLSGVLRYDAMEYEIVVELGENGTKASNGDEMDVDQENTASPGDLSFAHVRVLQDDDD
jgi:hypothetical protein